MLPLDVLDILVAEQSFLGRVAYYYLSGTCLDLKGEDYDHGILCAMNIVYRIVYMLKLV
jgi:hypothetical protein